MERVAMIHPNTTAPIVVFVKDADDRPYGKNGWADLSKGHAWMRLDWTRLYQLDWLRMVR